MCEIAGYVGVDPYDFTLRELLYMRDGKEEVAWWHTAAVRSTIANSQRDPKKKPSPYTPDDFYPKPKKKRQADAKVPISILKKVFIDGVQPSKNKSRPGVHRDNG